MLGRLTPTLALAARAEHPTGCTFLRWKLEVSKVSEGRVSGGLPPWQDFLLHSPVALPLERLPRPLLALLPLKPKGAQPQCFS